jgi:hypothetical protein
MTRLSPAARPEPRRYPVLAAFGDHVQFLSQAEAASASRDERIRSVWPFLTQLVLEFAATLPPRARGNFDPEDILLELYVALCQKDGLYDPGRGHYVNFVGSIATRELLAVRDRMATVRCPKNGLSRARQYAEAEAADRLSEQQRWTHRDLMRALGAHGVGPTAEPADGLAGAAEQPRDDEYRRLCEAIRRALFGLSFAEARVLSRAYGLFGRRAETVEEIAAAEGKSRPDVQKVLNLATRKFRRRLESLARRGDGRDWPKCDPGGPGLDTQVGHPRARRNVPNVPYERTP